MSEAPVEYTVPDGAGQTAGEGAAEADVVAAPAAPAAPGPVIRAGAWVEFCLNTGPSVGAWRPALCVSVDGSGGACLHVFCDDFVDALLSPRYERGVTFGAEPGRWRVVESA